MDIELDIYSICCRQRSSRKSGFNGILGVEAGLIVTILIIYIVWVVIWILGIVNAVKIHGITHQSIALVIFSVIPLYLVHLIFAVIDKNKFEDYTPIITTLPTQNRASEISGKDHLKDAFIKGVISTKEYEDKLNELNEKDESAKNK